MSRTWTIPARIFVSPSGVRGCSSMVEPLPSKQITRVRFPSSAPAMRKPRATRPGAFALHPHAHAVSGNMGVIGHYVLLCGAGCCLWTRGFSGRRARPWGRAAPWATRPRAVRAASFDRRVGSLSGQAPPPTGTAARVPRSSAFRSLRCRGRALRLLRRPPRRWRWGFCSIRGWLSACRRRVVILMTPFPPFGGGEITV